MDLERTAALVSKYLADNGVKKQHLAAQIGLSLRSFNNRLNGFTKFTFNESIRLAEIIGCSLDDFTDKRAQS